MRRRNLGWRWLVGLNLLGLVLSAFPAPAPRRAEAAASRPAGPLLLEANEQHIVLEWTAPPYQVAEESVEGQAVHEVSVPGCPATGRPGQPRLPVCTIFLGVPPDARLDLRITEEEHTPVPGVFRLPPILEPVIEEDLPPGMPAGVRLVGNRRVEGPAYQEDRPFPAQPARLGETAFLRHQRIVPLSFYPLQYRPRSGQLLYTSRARLEITFADAQEPTGYIAEPPAFERLLADMLLNYTSARGWRRTTAMPLDIPPPPPSPGWRIPVSQEGVYRLTYERLRDAGLPVDDLDPHTLRLYRYGQEVAVRVVGEEDNHLNPGDFLLFYGRPLTNNRYSDTEVYWLTYGGTWGRRMPQRDGSPDGIAPVPPSFLTSERREENHLYYSQMPWRPDHDHWFWNFTYPEKGVREQVYSFPAHPLAAESYTAHLRLHLYGWTRDDLVQPDHHLRVFLNDVLLEEIWWDGQEELTPTLSFPSTLLQAGGNTVRIECPGDTGAFAEFNAHDWLELEQRRRFAAEGDRLTWTGAGGNWEYLLTGFSEPDILLLDITDPDGPVQIISATVKAEGSAYTVRFSDTVAGPTDYLVWSNGQVREPTTIEPAEPADLRDPARVDYLVLSPHSLITQALTLASFRDVQGLEALAVEVEDVYDLFAYGRRVPEAVHDFLAYTYDHWTPPAPSYVVLLGDGHYDPKNYLGYGTPEHILPYLAFVDPWIGETAADNRYVCLSGEDALPDMHLGRLPANNPDQAQVMVNKIVTYEGAPPPGDWTQHSLFIADNADQAGDFAALSDNLIAGYYPEPYQDHRVYLGVTHPYENPSVAAHNAIITHTNAGRLLINYIGHGGPGVWASERLLSITQLSQLANAPYYPVVAAMTCYEGSFHYPYADWPFFALAETFLRADGRGWAASWSPTGLGVATGHHFLDEGFFQALFLDDERFLGPATLAGKLRLYGAGAWLDLLDTYLLLGDPALALPLLPNNLILDKAARPETPLQPGDPLTFTLSFANTGPATAHHIVLTDTLAPILVSPTFQARGVEVVARPGTPYVWDVSDMVAGQTGTVTISAYVSDQSPAGYWNNQAAIYTRLDANPQDNTDQVTLLIIPGPPHRITVTADPPALPADGNSLSLLDARVADTAGNPVADGTPVFFTTDAGTFPNGGTHYQGETAQGSAQTFLRAADQVMTATVTVTSGEALGWVLVPFASTEPHTITVAAEPTVIPVTGTAHITATVSDVLGHPVRDGTPVTFTTSFALITPTLGATQGGKAFTTLYGEGLSGLATIVAHSGGAAGSAVVRIGSGSDYTLTLEVTPTRLPADGVSQAVVTATLERADGRPLTGTHEVDFRATLGEIPSRSLIISGTTATVVSYTAGTQIGTALIVAASEGASDAAVVRLTAGGPSILTLTATPASVPVGGSSALLVATVRDALGHPVADGTLVSWSTDLGTVSPTVVPTWQGQARSFLTSGTEAGTAMVRAETAAISDTAEVLFLPLPPATMTLTVTPPVLIADGVSTATVTAWVGDPFLNPVQDGTVVRFYTTLGQVSPAEAATSQGQAATVLFAGTEVGTATVQGLAENAQAQRLVPLVASGPASLLILADPFRIAADGVSTATVTAYVWDAVGHPVADGTSVSFSTDLGTVAPEVVPTQAGRAIATLRSATAEGWATVRAECGPASGQTQVEFFLYHAYLPQMPRGLGPHRVYLPLVLRPGP